MTERRAKRLSAKTCWATSSNASTACPTRFSTTYPRAFLLDRLGAELRLGFEPETVEERRELQLWRGWELPPHEPEPQEDAEQEDAIELSS